MSTETYPIEIAGVKRELRLFQVAQSVVSGLCRAIAFQLYAIGQGNRI